MGENEKSAASIVSSVLTMEAQRNLEAARQANTVVFPDELLPGVGAAESSMREGLRKAGAATFVTLMILNALDQLEGSSLSVLAPNIRKTFHMSSGAIVFVTAASGGFLILGALPMGWLADRFRRAPIVAWAGVAFSAMVFLTGLSVNAFTLFLARFGVGVSKSSTLPVHGSLLADAYPIGLRGRIAAATGVAGGVATTVSPIAAGAVASLAGGGSGWRWAFFILGAPVVIVALMAFRLPEPPRGQYEMRHVLGEVIEDARPAPISTEAAFARLMRIRTIRMSVMAFSAIGFGLFTGPVLANLFLDQHYHLDAFQRGLAGTVAGICVLAILPLIGPRYDRLYRRDPAKALRLVGLLVVPAGLLTPIQYFMPSAVLWIVLGVPQTVLLLTSYTMVGPVMQSVVPYRLRGLGSAFAAIYIFFIGATGGALLAAFFTNAFGVRTAVLALVVPSTLAGGILIVRSAAFIRGDLSLVVAELQDELSEHERQMEAPELIPVVQVSHLDFSYGHVQVLFDVGFEVRRGEVLALLGTNGAGKSTVLRLIAGLGTPTRGVVRYGGRNITYVSPEQRARLGLQLLPGGRGVFPTMTVDDNLEIGAYLYRHDPTDMHRRIDAALELLPELALRRTQLAGSLSGGQQQMLALARTLLHEPDLLMIDELSLGLAPVVVQDLIKVIERIKADGRTIIVVEQSLNVASAIADRAVFMEKGQVRFEGSPRELLERQDLARAVFLGGEGG